MMGKIVLFLLFILFIWGNLVAGLHAGLGCPDWPLCYGEVVPPYRWDTYMEFMHRVIGGIASIFLIIFCYMRFRAYSGGVKLIPIITVLLLIFQIILGGIVVILELPVDLTTFHFGNAMLIFALTLYMYHFDGKDNKPSFGLTGYKGLFFLLAIIIFIQLVLGAYVRHSSSGLACPDFPTCLGYWIPPELSGMILNHYAHRTLAYIITIITAVLLIVSYYSDALKKYRLELWLLVAFILVQILLGVGVVFSKLNFAVTALHLTFALLILSTALYAWFRGMRESRV
ncbi:MAG: COX15/CtaA family protein [Thermodesulfobacteriota bacterium]